MRALSCAEGDPLPLPPPQVEGKLEREDNGNLHVPRGYELCPNWASLTLKSAAVPTSFKIVSAALGLGLHSLHGAVETNATFCPSGAGPAAHNARAGHRLRPDGDAPQGEGTNTFFPSVALVASSSACCAFILAELLVPACFTWT